MNWRERLADAVNSVKDFFTERDVEHSPIQEPEAPGSNTTSREDVRPEEPGVVSVEDQRENQRYLDQAQAVLEWLENMREQFPGNDSVASLGEEIQASARSILDPDTPLDWKPDEVDDMHRAMADLKSCFHQETGPDILSETDWMIEDNGTESKIYIGQGEHGYYYAVEHSPADDQEDDLRWQGPYPTEDEAEGAVYGVEHDGQEATSSFWEEEAAVPSVPEVQNSHVLDEVPGSGEQEQEEPSR